MFRFLIYSGNLNLILADPLDPVRPRLKYGIFDGQGQKTGIEKIKFNSREPRPDVIGTGGEHPF